ncbi:MAG: hypothetical protein KAJ86_07810 [Alphaproteobacteria bacterium]|nr:hypothetical protein [Alphaproteobacteria bacterium]
MTKKVIQSHPTTKAFNPANTMITVGKIQLNKTSQHLKYLPNEANAILLVSPKDISVIFKRDINTWIEDIKSIRSINENHDLHYDGNILTGMQVFDKCEGNKYNDPIEKAIANQLRAAWVEAKDSGKDIVTDLFMGTKEIVHGREIDSGSVTVPHNLYSRRKIIAKQGGEFITECEELNFNNGACWQHSSTEFSPYSFTTYIIDFRDGDNNQNRKHKSFSSRPVALQVLAPSL